MIRASRLYTAHELAHILQVHEETVCTLRRCGRLKRINLGPHPTLWGHIQWRVTDRDLRQFLNLDTVSDLSGGWVEGE